MGARSPDHSCPQVHPTASVLLRGTTTPWQVSDDLSRGKQIRDALGGGRWRGVIATSEEGSFREGNKLDRGAGTQYQRHLRGWHLWTLWFWERCAGGGGPHGPTLWSVQFLIMQWIGVKLWRGILKQMKLYSFCLHCFFLSFFFSSLLGLQEGNGTICSYQECSSKPVFPPRLPDAMILVKEINSFTGCDT